MIFDPLPALRALHDAGVRFVMIGGLAGRQRGSTTYTNDLDVCYDRAPDNLERLAAALNGMHARPLRTGDAFTFDTEFGALDVLATPSGATGYADLVTGAAGRPEDRIEVEVLLALRDEITEAS